MTQIWTCQKSILSGALKNWDKDDVDIVLVWPLPIFIIPLKLELNSICSRAAGMKLNSS